MCGELCSKCFDQNNSNGKFGQHVLIKRCRTTHILQGNWFRKSLVEAKPNVKLLQTKVANSHPLYKGNEFRNNVCRNNTNENVFKTKIFTTTYTFIRKPVFENPNKNCLKKYQLTSQKSSYLVSEEDLEKNSTSNIGQKGPTNNVKGSTATYDVHGAK